MTTEKQLEKPSKIAFLFPSSVILVIIGLQLYTAQHLRDYWPKFRTLQKPHKLLEPPPKPALWPFIDYPMYSYSNNLGDGINQYSVLAVLENGQEVEIVAEDLGLDYWVFNYGLQQSLRAENEEDVQKFASLYEELQGKKLIKIRLENQPLILKEDGLGQGEKEVVSEFSLEAEEKKN